MSLLQPGTILKTGTWENIVFLNKTCNTWNNQFLWDSLESCCAVTPSCWQNLLHQIVSDRTKKPLIRRMLTELDYVSFFFFIFPPTENVLSSRLLCAHLSSLHLSVKHRLRVVTYSPGAGLFFFIHLFILSIYSCFPFFFFKAILNSSIKDLRLKDDKSPENVRDSSCRVFAAWGWQSIPPGCIANGTQGWESYSVGIF